MPYEKGRKLLDRELEPEENCVRGTLVIGLTLGDIARLDIFEGSVSVTRFPMDVTDGSIGIHSRSCDGVSSRRADAAREVS